MDGGNEQVAVHDNIVLLKKSGKIQALENFIKGPLHRQSPPMGIGA